MLVRTDTTLDLSQKARKDESVPLDAVYEPNVPLPVRTRPAEVRVALRRTRRSRFWGRLGPRRQGCTLGAAEVLEEGLPDHR